MPCRARHLLLSLVSAAALLAPVSTAAAASTGPPVITTDAVTSVGRHEATFHGTVDGARGTTLSWFQYGLTDRYGTGTSPVESGDGPVESTATALAAGTTYHLRAVTWNGEAEPAYGSDLTFTTAEGAPPILTTGAATSITRTSATLNATVEAPFDTARYAFEYGPTDGYGDAGGKGEIEPGDGATATSLDLTGLTPGTTYHFHVFAENQDGWASGADATFTTALEPPAATATEPREITETAATVTGFITTAGWSTDWHVEYGPTVAYGRVTDAVTETADGPVAVRLDGLVPATSYHYRFVAENLDGARSSADAQLKTAGTIPVPEPELQEAPAPVSITAPPTAATPVSPVDPGPAARFAFARMPNSPAIRITRSAALVRARCDGPADGPCTAAVELYERASVAGAVTLRLIGRGQRPLPAGSGRPAVVTVALTGRGRDLVEATAREGTPALRITVRLRSGSAGGSDGAAFVTRPVRLTRTS